LIFDYLHSEQFEEQLRDYLQQQTGRFLDRDLAILSRK